jgi:hypothetical protein
MAMGEGGEEAPAEVSQGTPEASIGEVEREVMAGLPGAVEFRKKVFSLYDEYRFPTLEEKLPTRHRHVATVTENALKVGKEYGLSRYWMGILWKAGLLHDLGQARAGDYALCAKVRDFAKEHGIPYRPQLMIEYLQRDGAAVDRDALFKLYEQFFRMLKEAGYDMKEYGEERIGRVCKALFHDSFSVQIMEKHSKELPLQMEGEVRYIVGYHTYPEMLPAEAGPDARILTEILKCVDGVDARSDFERNAVYKRPAGFKLSLADAEGFLIGEYNAGHISRKVIEAVYRLVHGDNDEFRRLIMRARYQPEDAAWPDYDAKYRAMPLEEVLRSAGEIKHEWGGGATMAISKGDEEKKAPGPSQLAFGRRISESEISHAMGVIKTAGSAVDAARHLADNKDRPIYFRRYNNNDTKESVFTFVDVTGAPVAIIKKRLLTERLPPGELPAFVTAEIKADYDFAESLLRDFVRIFYRQSNPCGHIRFFREACAKEDQVDINEAYALMRIALASHAAKVLEKYRRYRKMMSPDAAAHRAIEESEKAQGAPANPLARLKNIRQGRWFKEEWAATKAATVSGRVPNCIALAELYLVDPSANRLAELLKAASARSGFIKDIARVFLDRNKRIIFCEGAAVRFTIDEKMMQEYLAGPLEAKLQSADERVRSAAASLKKELLAAGETNGGLARRSSESLRVDGVGGLQAALVPGAILQSAAGHTVPMRTETGSGQPLAVVRMQGAALPREALDYPHAHQGEVTDTLGLRDLLDRLDGGIVDSHRYELLARLGKSGTANLGKLVEVIRDRMSLPEPGLLHFGFEFGNSLSLHIFSSPRISSTLRIIHRPGSDDSRDAARLGLDDDRKISAAIGLAEHIISLLSGTKNKGAVVAGLLDLIRNDPVLRDVAYIGFVPFKGPELQGLSSLFDSSIHVYTKDVKRKVPEVSEAGAISERDTPSPSAPAESHPATVAMGEGDKSESPCPVEVVEPEVLPADTMPSAVLADDGIGNPVLVDGVDFQTYTTGGKACGVSQKDLAALTPLLKRLAAFRDRFNRDAGVHAIDFDVTRLDYVKNKYVINIDIKFANETLTVMESAVIDGPSMAGPFTVSGRCRKAFGNDIKLVEMPAVSGLTSLNTDVPAACVRMFEDILLALRIYPRDVTAIVEQAGRRLIPASHGDVGRFDIHAANLDMTPRIRRKTMLCHIITDSIVSVEQRDMLEKAVKQEIKKRAAMGEDFRESVTCISSANAGDPARFIRDIKDKMMKEAEAYRELGYADVKFDIACPDTDLVEAVLGSGLGIKALAFKQYGGDVFTVAEVEGIMYALRALYWDDIDRLKNAFTYLGSALSKDQIMITDVDVFIKHKDTVFTLPHARIEDANERRRRNDLIATNIKQAA